MRRGRQIRASSTRRRYDGSLPRVVLYHGTGASLLSSIRREGLRPDAPHTYGISRHGGLGIYATPDFDQACFFACDGAWRNFGDDAVVLAFAPPTGVDLWNDRSILRPDLAPRAVSDQLPPEVTIPPSALYLWTEYGWASLPSTMDDEAVCLDCRAVLGEG